MAKALWVREASWLKALGMAREGKDEVANPGVRGDALGLEVVDRANG